MDKQRIMRNEALIQGKFFSGGGGSSGSDDEIVQSMESATSATYGVSSASGISRKVAGAYTSPSRPQEGPFFIEMTRCSGAIAFPTIFVFVSCTLLVSF